MTFKMRGRVKDDAPQLRSACKALEHYHIAHTDDIVTTLKPERFVKSIPTEPIFLPVCHHPKVADSNTPKNTDFRPCFR
jgi:hypothetical protein